MAHVTIPDTAPRVQYTVGGTSTTDFTIPFAYFADSDIKVYVGSTLKTLSTDYTITGTAVDEGYSGGTVVLGTGVTNTTVTVLRDVPVKRITDFPTNGPFNITQLNTELDSLTAQLQQEETGHDLFLRIAEYDTYTDLTLPVKADRAGTVLGFNATTGDPEAGPTIADVSTLAAITADIATLADIEDGTDATDAIQTVAGISGNVTTVAGISGNVTTVAGISADVTAVAADATDIGTVAGSIGDVNTVAGISANVTTVAGIDSDVTTVAGISADVTTVAGIDSDVSAVAAIDSDVTAVAADATDIGTVSSNIANVNTVAGISANVTTVAGISANVTSVAGNATNINTVAGIDSNVSTVAGIAADVTAVANNEVNVSQVATDIAKVIEVANDLQEVVSEIDTVANNIANVNTVGTAIADVSAVAAIDSNVTTVSGISANVTTVAGVSANVTTVAGISANVTTVAGISADVTTVAGDAADIATVAGISADVSAVAAIDSDITTAAANVTDITNFADVYIGASATAPTTRNDSSALQVGDLYFDTSTDTMKVYSSGGWTAAGSSVNGTANRYDYVVGTSSGSYTGSTTNFPATYDAGYVDVFLNGTKLVPTTDFTATSGTEIVLGTAASSGSNICIVGYGTFSLANFSVGDANDVDLSGISDGDALLYNSTSGNFEAGPITVPTPAAVSDAANSSTGYFALPAGTTAQRPGSPAAGYARMNTTTGSVEFYDGTNWISTNLIPTINSITGTIYAGVATTLTLSLTNATDTIDVKYYEGGTLLATDAGVTVTSGSATSTVPSAVYGQTGGDTITIQITNQDGTPSSNSVNKTVTATPTGGTITTSGSYRIHTFTSSSSFVVPTGMTLSNVEYVVVAGGGGGGAGNRGGGGGAGGYRSSVSGESSGGGASAESKLTLTAGSYTVTVGAGGVTYPYSTDHAGPYAGENGANSVFGSITSTGGGGGGYGDNGGANQDPQSGGSGGGGWYGSQFGVSGTSGQGYAGGAGGSSPPYGGGGGGAGEAGKAFNDGSRPSEGGNGVASSITGSSVYRAGGGGSGTYPGQAGPVSASGGLGGGGSGGNSSGTYNTAPYNGTANTGGGGGAAGYGGSGIVIVRYQLS